MAATKAFTKQYLEIFPLNGARILKFVDHDVLKLRSDFFEDKRCVAVLDKGVKEHLRVAKEETVGGFVEFSHFGFNFSQEPELVEMTQGEHGGLIEAGLPTARLFG